MEFTELMKEWLDLLEKQRKAYPIQTNEDMLRMLELEYEINKRMRGEL